MTFGWQHVTLLIVAQFSELLDRYQTVTGYSMYWVMGVTGLTLIFLAILNTLHRRPKDRWVWSYSLIRLCAGLLIGILGFTVPLWSDDAAAWP